MASSMRRSMSDVGKEHSQREKNREAVRNCRKRKREQALQLREKVERLKEENERLKQIITGTQPLTESPKITVHEEKTDFDSMIDEMELSLKKGVSESHIRNIVGIFMKKHSDHGRDKRKKIHFLAEGMKKLVKPTPFTMFWMFLLAQEKDSFYLNSGTKESNKDLDCNMFKYSTSQRFSFQFPGEKSFSTKTDNLWEQICNYLNLSPAQIEEWKKRRKFAQRLKVEVEYSFRRIQALWTKLYDSKSAADSMFELHSILSPTQLLKFILWVQKDPACKDLLNSLWDTLMKKYDKSIIEEIRRGKDYRNFAKQFQILGAKYTASMFTTYHQQRLKIAKLVFHPNIKLVDVNNAADVRGVEECERYIESVGHAFSREFAMTYQETHLDYDEEAGKVNLKWVLSGHYVGKLLKKKEQKIDSSNGMFARLQVIGDFVYGDFDYPELITEINIDWDVIGLIEQLEKEDTHDHSLCLPGFQRPKPLQHANSAEPPEHSHELEALPPGASFEDQCLQLHRELVQDLALAYQVEEDKAEETAVRLMSPNIMFMELDSGVEYRGLKEVIAYLRRMRRLFPSFKISDKQIVRFTPLHLVEEYRGLINEEDSRGLYRIEALWKVEAAYKGRLLAEKDRKSGRTIVCDMTMLIECCVLEKKIKKVFLNVFGQDMMQQIGAV